MRDRATRSTGYRRWRCTSLVSAGMILCAISAFATQQFEDRYGYIVDAANKISEIYYHPGRPSNEDQDKVAQIACEALSTLSRGPNLRADLNKIASRRPDYQKQIEELRSNFQPFITKFLVIEREQLLSEGFDRRLVDATVFQLELSRAAVGSQKLDVEGQINQIGALANAACRLSEMLKKGARNRAVAHAATSAIVLGLGGVILMVVDAGAEGSSGGVATPIAALSVEIGMEMIVEGGRETNRLIELISAR